MSKNGRTGRGKNMKKLFSVLLCSCSTFAALTLAKSKQILRFMKEKIQFFFSGKEK